MAYFHFNQDAFSDEESSVRIFAQNNYNNISSTPLSTTRSTSDIKGLSTAYSLSDVLQGAALYKPTTLAYDSLSRVSEDLLIKTTGGDISSSIRSEVAALLPSDIGNTQVLDETGAISTYSKLADRSNPANNFGYGSVAADVSVDDIQRSINQNFSPIHPSEIDTIANNNSTINGTTVKELLPPQEFLPFGNGRIPTNLLAPLEGQSTAFKLWAPAAKAFNALRREAIASGFSDPFVISAYRDYDTQVKLKQEKGKWAASPGTSKHGWAIAIDFHSHFRNGKNNSGQTGFDWLNENAHRFGYVHPTWARPGGSLPEPWHWEYRGHLATDVGVIALPGG